MGELVTVQVNGQKALCMPEKSPDRPDFSSPMIMDVPASRTVRTKCLLFKSPSVGHFVKAALLPPKKDSLFLLTSIFLHSALNACELAYVFVQVFKCFSFWMWFN